ncbi:MAG: hypothetical protein EAZ61_01405 [Oscillatoriales cyanobacterium]|nr:MAG: hypothetical protein EAZ61_01405 [Oscillatoriales cyanobacterium]
MSFENTLNPGYLGKDTMMLRTIMTIDARRQPWTQAWTRRENQENQAIRAIRANWANRELTIRLGDDR